MFANNKVLMFT